MKNVINKKRIDINLIIYLFVFFFAPPIIPKININILQAGFSLIYILHTYSIRTIKNLLVKSKMYRFLGIFGLVIFYMILTSLIGMVLQPVNITNYVENFYGIFLFTVILMINIVYVLLMCQKLGFGLTDVLRHCIYAGLIQAVIAFIMLLNSEFRQVINNIIYRNAANVLLQKDWFTETRGFAFANDTLDSFGYGVGILSGIAFYFGMELKKRYLLNSVLLMMLVFLNARTGIIMASIGVGVWLLVHLKENRSGFGKYLFLALLLSGILIVAFHFLERQSPATARWITKDITAMFQKMQGKETQKYTVVNQLFSDSFWALPGVFGIIFGTGHNVYNAVGYQHSDVGYINLIWQIGILGMIAVMLIFGNLFFQGYKKSKSQLGRWLAIYVALAFYVFNIKGKVLTYTPGSAVTMLVIFAVIYFSRTDVRKML